MSTSILQIVSAAPISIAAFLIALLGVRQIYEASTGNFQKDDERLMAFIAAVFLMAFSGGGFVLAAVILKMAGAQ